MIASPGRHRASQNGWHFPGAPFLLAALILTIAFGIAWRVTLGRSRFRVVAENID